MDGKQIELRYVTRGKHSRLVADVYVNNMNVANPLSARALAVNYTEKGKKFDWCEDG